LILCPESPYPLAGGGALRSAALIEYLAGRYRLDAIAFRQPGTRNPEDTRLAEMAHRLLVVNLPAHGRHSAARAARNVDRLLRGIPPLTDRFAGFEGEIAPWLAAARYELGVIEHFWCAPYAATLGSAAGRLVLDLHNIESALHQGCADSEQWPLSLLHRRFAAVCRRLERRWLPAFSCVLTASAEDARRVEEIAPGAAASVYPNTIPELPAPLRREEEVIAFSANLEYHPNTNAVRWFRREVWPLLRARCPRLIWRLIGKNPEAVRRWVSDDPRIETTGPVDDAIAELARAKAAVVPLLAGSGTRVKILEAWAAGTPVVSTPVGAEGLGGEPGRHLVVAASAPAFADAVAALLADDGRRRSIAEAARALFCSAYTWPAGWRRLDAMGIGTAAGAARKESAI
jgi:glycosyltransferase involved in cell wall biosynthesis